MRKYTNGFVSADEGVEKNEADPRNGKSEKGRNDDFWKTQRGFWGRG